MWPVPSVPGPSDQPPNQRTRHPESAVWDERGTENSGVEEGGRDMRSLQAGDHDHLLMKPEEKPRKVRGEEGERLLYLANFLQRLLPDGRHCLDGQQEGRPRFARKVDLFPVVSVRISWEGENRLIRRISAASTRPMQHKSKSI